MKLAFIGGGNMAAALLSGLRREHAAGEMHVVEPGYPRRAELVRDFGVDVSPAPGERESCFRAFLHNQWVGAALFAGIVADYALR